MTSHRVVCAKRSRARRPCERSAAPISERNATNARLQHRMVDEASPPVDLSAWIASNRELLDRGQAGPVIAGELKALLVAGRGPRRDYHVNSVAELFYQLDGDISVTLRDAAGMREIHIRTGELWLAPAGIPHSPQRPTGTVGLVVERTRDAASTEAFRWFCDACGAVVFDIVLNVVDPVELRRAMLEFYASETARTCRSCGEVVRPP
jgi:3-hydroxyanthranilate 3,4-dioxygenase